MVHSKRKRQSSLASLPKADNNLNEEDLLLVSRNSTSHPKMLLLPPDLEAYVQEKLANGQFGSREELTIEAMRVYREVEAKHAALKTDIQAAILESDAGLSQPLDIEAIKAEVFREFEPNSR
jgi:Arc/MetJ-type ribon-helix-helix transcriptional regulator